MQFTNQLKYMSSKLEWANFDQNSWADTLLWDMTTLKRYVDPRTPASQLSPLFLLLQWGYYFLLAYSRNKSPHRVTRKVQSQTPLIFFSHPMHFSAEALHNLHSSSRISESTRLEETLKIIQSNHQPKVIIVTPGTYPWVPHPGTWTLPETVSPPVAWAIYSSA